MQNNNPFITIIICCRNEEKFIRGCLNSVLGQNYLKEKMEILVVEGMSEDKTRCVKYLYQYNADNVGGIMKTLPAKNTIIAKAIAQSLSDPFGAGSSYFRIGSKKVRWADTVFGGCYKKEVFKKIGLFNENLVRFQDMEFNLRLEKAVLIFQK